MHPPFFFSKVHVVNRHLIWSGLLTFLILTLFPPSPPPLPFSKDLEFIQSVFVAANIAVLVLKLLYGDLSDFVFCVGVATASLMSRTVMLSRCGSLLPSHFKKTQRILWLFQNYFTSDPSRAIVVGSFTLYAMAPKWLLPPQVGTAGATVYAAYYLCRMSMNTYKGVQAAWFADDTPTPAAPPAPTRVGSSWRAKDAKEATETRASRNATSIFNQAVEFNIQQGGGTPPIAWLPDELLRAVLSLVDAKTLVFSAPLVCKAWQKICSDFDSVYRAATRADFGDCSSLTDAALRSVTAKCPRLTHADFWNCRNLTNAAVISLATACRGLTHADFSYCANLTDEALRALARMCSGLVQASVSGTREPRSCRESARGH